MKNNNKKDDWEDCDDCAVCRAMKNGEANDMEGLMKAFAEAEKDGVGKVGFGDRDENDDSVPSPYTK
ncbi:MAG: hypothetical protein PHT16_00470 [Candidatus Pacebacteria bacterium]|nr:hypothetical protein [Candidatus Paceibacterota bacterium]